MAICQPCGTEIIGQDRFCRNCGAPVAALAGDLVGTHRFNATAPPSAHPGSQDPTNPFYVPPPVAHPIAPGAAPSYQTGSIGKRLFQRKSFWLVFPMIFLLLSLFVSAGVTIGRSVLRSRQAARARQAEWAERATERAKQARRAKQAEIARRAFEEAVQNALGFVPASLSEAEYPDLQGIFVGNLTSDDSPAARAHIQAGDVLTELSDQVVRNSSELTQVLNSLKPGAEVKVKLYRDGETVTSPIKITNLSIAPFQPKTEPRDQGFLGLGDVSRRCCLPGTKKWGLEVHRVIDNSPADLAGLQLGDVITEFDQRAMRTPDEFSRRIRGAKPRSKVKLKFYRGNTEQTVELIMGHGW